MENTSTYNRTHTSPLFPAFGKAPLTRKAAKAERAKQLESKVWYSAKEACIYIGYSRAVLRRMIDLRLLRPTKRKWFGCHRYYAQHLDAAKERYETLKKEKMLNKLPACTCLQF